MTKTKIITKEIIEDIFKRNSGIKSLDKDFIIRFVEKFEPLEIAAGTPEYLLCSVFEFFYAILDLIKIEAHRQKYIDIINFMEVLPEDVQKYIYEFFDAVSCEKMEDKRKICALFGDRLKKLWSTYKYNNL